MQAITMRIKLEWVTQVLKLCTINDSFFNLENKAHNWYNV
jgi:hypothetical protein